MKTRARLVPLVAVALAAACAPRARRDAEVEDAPALDAMEGSAPDVSAPDAPALDAPAPDVPALDAPVVPDAPPLDAPVPDAPALDAPSLDAPEGAAVDALPVVDAPVAEAAADAPAGDAGPLPYSCSNAVATLTGNDDEHFVRVTGPSREFAHGCATDTPGPEAVFFFSNPAASRWFFSTDDPRTTADTVITTRQSCSDATSEEDCVDDGLGAMGRTRFSTYIRRLRNYALWIDRRDGSGPYNVVLRARRVTIARNAICLTSPTAITADGARVSRENLEAAYNDDAECAFVNNAPQLYYRLSVPPMTQVAVTATPTAPLPLSWRPRVRITDLCDGPCRDYNTAAADGEAVTSYAVNATAMPREFYVSVASSQTEVFGTYELTTRALVLQPGQSCEVPEELAVGVTARDRSTRDGGGPSDGCGATGTGARRHFRLTVPAGRTVRVTVRPTGDPWTAVLRRQQGCPVSECAALARSETQGAAATLDLDNPTAAARAMHFTVAAQGLEAHSYDVSTELLPGVFPYVESTVPVRCDALSAASTVRAAATGDDVASPPEPLPFPFAYFGEPAARFSLSSNGFAQLYGAAGGEPLASPRTSALPAGAAPNGVVAPYWADLVPRFAPAGEVRAGLVSDEQGRRLTIHWNNFFVRGRSASLVGVQLKLFEATNAIEFHYCVLSDGDNPIAVRGGVATVGLESIDGALGTTHARNVPRALDPTIALRYAPRGASAP